MKTALVTGAKGMLAQDLIPALEDNGYDVIETDIDNLDITNFDMVQEVLKRENPDIVIHCAAYTNVDLAESEFEKARLINAEGTKNLAIICSELDIPIVYISTDYVFDGTKNSPYLTSDKPNPINKYGLTKLEGEIAIQKHCKKFYIARTSWLYGIHGKNFVETMIGLKDKTELKVVDDQTGSPTWACDLADGIIDIIENEDYGIYHLTGSGEVSWYNFAKEIFNLAGLNVNLKPCTTDEFPRPAKRPKYSVLDNEGRLRNWKDALKYYMLLRD